MPKTMQRSFAGGVMSPFMMARTDDIKFQSGLAECTNFYVLPQGPVANRTGFEYVAEAKYSDRKCRLIPFSYSLDQTMVLEFGHKYVRFHTQGKTLYDGDAPYELASPYDEKDLFDLHFVQSNDILTIVHESYAPKELRRYSYTDWRFADISFGPKLSPPSNVRAVRETSASEDDNADRYTQYYRVTALNKDKTSESLVSATVSCVANLYATGTTVKISWDAVSGATFYRIYKNLGGVYGYIGETEEQFIIDDNIAPEGDITPRRYDEAFGALNGIGSVTVTNQGSGYTDLVEVSSYSNTIYIDSYRRDQVLPFDTSYFIEDGTSVSLKDRKQKWEVVDTEGSGSGAKVTPIYEVINGLLYLTGFNIVSGGSGYVNPVLYGYYYVMTGNYTGEYEKMITVNLKTRSIKADVLLNVTDPTGSGAELVPTITNGKITAVTVRRSGMGYTNPEISVVSTRGSGAAMTATVASSAGNYPSAVAYHEQRRCFAGFSNNPQRIVMTRSGTEDDMTYSLPSQDDDCINIEVAARGNNPIKHLVPMSTLIMLTAAGEWRVATGNSDFITPSSITVKQTSFVGANNVQPLVVNSSMLYCAERGGHVREYSYNSDAGGYITGDLSLRANHLFDGKTLVDCTFSKSPYPIGWFVSSDGTLLGLTYVPEQSVGAWHTHNTDGWFESCCCVAEGDDDILYCVVNRLIGGENVRQIERMTERDREVFVDAAGIYEGEETTTVSGLERLEGKLVSILADGAVVPPKRVTNGTVTIPIPAKRVVVGLQYISQIKTLPLEMTLSDKSSSNGRMKNVNHTFLRVVDSSGIWVGASEDRLVEYKQRTTEAYGEATKPITGELDIMLKPAWTQGGEVYVRQEDPLPVTVVGLCSDIRVA